MATAPTRILGVTPTLGWASGTSPKTSPTFDVVTGDLLVLQAFSEDSTSPLGAPTWTGTGTWTLQQSITVSNYCTAYLYTCAVTATQTGRTISMGRTASNGQFSFIASAWRNHGGIGNSAKANVASGAPSLALTTAANSAVIFGNSDWTASSGTRTWRTVNGAAITETSFGGVAGSTYMCYTGYAPDAGAAGSETLGMTAPAAQKYSIIGIEVLGTAGSEAFPITATLSGSGSLTATMTLAVNTSAALTGSGALTGAMSPSMAKAAALSGAGSLTSTLTPSVAAQADLSGAGSLTADIAPDLQIAATLDGTGALTATLSGTTHHQWTATLQGEGALTATLTKGITIHCVFNATGDLTATLTPAHTITATLTGSGTLTDAQEPNMAQPSPDWGLVLLKWAGTCLDGNPCTGRLKVTYTGGIRQDADLETPISIYPAQFSVPLTTKVVLFSGAPRTVGYAEFWLPATNDPDITGATDAYYTLSEELNAGGGRTNIKFVAPFDTPADGIWLNTLETL